MMKDNSIEIDAPASDVWAVYSDVERWPEWTDSVERLVALDGPIAVGNRFEIEQPRLPKLVWEVTEVTDGVSWTWRQRSPGGTSFASHEVVAQEGGGTLVRLRIEQRGPIGAAVGLIMSRLTKRYLELEAQGLKGRVEQRRLDAPTT